MRAIYMKCLINTELDFEYLTEQEQEDLINRLILDHQISYPHKKGMIAIFINNDDGSLDW